MNGQEQVSLLELNKKVAAVVVQQEVVAKALKERTKLEDERWQEIRPIVDFYHDEGVRERFMRDIWHGIVVVLGVIATIGAATWAFLNILDKVSKH